MKIFSIAFFLTLLGICPLTAQNNIADKAMEQMKNGAYAQAVETWSRAISLEATNDVFFFKRGLCNLKLNRLNNALLDFNKASEFAPEKGEYAFQQGFVYFEQGDYSNAKWALENALKRDPQNVEYFLYKVKNLMALEQYRTAIEDCRKMLRAGDQEKPNPEILVQRALLYQKQKDRELADRDIKQAQKSAYESARLFASLGLYFKNEKDYAQAIRAYTKAHELDKTNNHYVYESAYLLLQIGDHQGCLEKSTKLMQFANARQLFPAGFILKATSAALLNKQDSHAYIYDMAVKDFAVEAKREQDYIFGATLFLEYLHRQDALMLARDWAMKAAGFSDSYPNNFLLAQIYYKLDQTTPAEETAKKAAEILKKQKGYEAEKKQVADLLASIAAKSADKTPPVLQITSPVAVRGGVIVEEVNEIIVVGFAHDDSGISKVLINGNLAKVEADGRFEGKTVLQGEQTKIIVQAIDKRGNEGMTNFIVEKKKPAPAKDSAPLLSTGGKNYAILFANNEYQHWGQLFNPVNDARVFAKDLENIYGFTTEIVENCTQEEFILKIREYIEKSYDQNDQLLIFYAGHGHFDETFKRGALVMKDSEYKAKTMKSYISYDELRSFISAIPCKHTLYIADACFSGTIDEKVARRGGEDNAAGNKQNLIDRIMSYTSRLYITSGGKEYVPDGKPGGHSPFMRRLLEAMRSEGGDGLMTLEELKTFFEGTKPKALFGELEANEPGGNFLFVKKTK